MADFLYRISELDEFLKKNGDPRIRDRFLLDSTRPLIVVCLVYLLVITVGVRWMRKREAFGLKWVMLGYNLVLVSVSGWMFVELLYATTKAGYSWICTPHRVSYDSYELRVNFAMYVYYFTKYLEMLDTVWIVLRKKNNQLSFLHVFHHLAMLISMHLCALFGGDGNAAIPACINSGVHVVMYSYYLLAAFPSLRKYLWWKRYITILQLSQFFIVTSHTTTTVFMDCGYPAWLAYLQLSIVLVLIVLFWNFYRKAYRREKEE